MRRAGIVGGLLAAGSVTIVRAARRRGGDRLLHAAPRTLPDEATLAPMLDALGGEVVRLRARDGVRLAARWLPFEAGDEAFEALVAAAGGPGSAVDPDADTPVPWVADPHEAILLLHGWSGSSAPDVVEYAPFLRRTASVLALDFRGHGLSDDGPTTFGMLEVEDVAGALAWLGERGVTRVAVHGLSMGGITGIAAVVVLGDGTLAAADADPARTRAEIDAPRPRIVAVVGDSVTPEIAIPVANRLPGPARRFTADRLFDGVTTVLGADPRATEPIRVVGLVGPVPLLLIHGEADRTVPIAAGRRLAAAAGPGAEQWVVPGADHCAAHGLDPATYEARVTRFLRDAFTAAHAVAHEAARSVERRTADQGESEKGAPVHSGDTGGDDMMTAPVEGTGDPANGPRSGED